MATPAAPLARYAPYRRAGDFILLSGIIAVDPAAGKIIRSYDDIPAEAQRLIGRTGEFSVDLREGPIRAQSWYVFDRIRATLEAAGGSLTDVVRLVQYFRNLDDYPQYNRIRNLFFPENPPTSTIVQVSAMLPNEHILVEVEATAYVPLT